MSWRSKKKRQKWKNSNNKNDAPTSSRPPDSLASRDDKRFPEPVKENISFETYYKGQNIVPEEEWDHFMQVLRVILPSSFRIAGTKECALELRDEMQKRYVPHLRNMKYGDGLTSEAPVPLPWYPDQLAWQHDAPKLLIKKAEEFQLFHKWLVTETTAGNVSRQEAVSMIPPFVLDVKPHHWVLDMCAAPGSKTAQIVEFLHAEDKIQTKNIPSGIVIANDMDEKRSHMLVHQIKRLKSPCVIVTCHDATQFPGLHIRQNSKSTTIQFDRILADVPCSGDGTIRKNIPLWKTWNINIALGLHPMQIRILLRGAQLLKEGARIVYSTCSLNPVENEAVVAEVLRRCQGNLRLVDLSDQLPELRRTPGLTHWKVMTKELRWIDRWEDLPKDILQTKRNFPKSLWPPQNVDQLKLERCWRIYPHYQNTGGFFIAVLEKTGPITDVSMTEDRKVETTTTEIETVIQGYDGEKTISHGDAEKTTSDGLRDGSGDAAQPPFVRDIDVDDKSEKSELFKGETEIPLARRHYSDDDHDDEENAESVESRKRVKTDKEKPGKTNDGETDQNTCETTSESAMVVAKKKGSDQKTPDDPFVFLERDDPDLESISKYYGLSDQFPKDLFLVRTLQPRRTIIYFVNNSIRRVLQAEDADRLKVVNTGTRAFIRSDVPYKIDCSFRFHQETISILYPYIQYRVVTADLKEVLVLLSEITPLISRFGEECRQKLEAMAEGGCLFYVDPLREQEGVFQVPIILPVWRAKVSVNLLYKKDEKIALRQRVSRYLNIVDETTTVVPQESEQVKEASTNNNSNDDGVDNWT